MIQGRLLEKHEHYLCARLYPSVCESFAGIQMPSLEGKDPLYLCRACARALRKQSKQMPEEPGPVTLVIHPQPVIEIQEVTLDFSLPGMTEPQLEMLPEDTSVLCQRPFPSFCLGRAEARITFLQQTLALCHACAEQLDKQLEQVPGGGLVTLQLYPQSELDSEPGEPTL